eukprot:259910_1
MSLHCQLDAHILKEGWLYKKGVYNSSFKRRWFVLFDDRTLHYFAKESHASSRSKAKGKIHLTQIRRVEFVQYIDPKHKNKSYRKSSLPIHNEYNSPLSMSPRLTTSFPFKYELPITLNKDNNNKYSIHRNKKVRINDKNVPHLEPNSISEPLPRLQRTSSFNEYTSSKLNQNKKRKKKHSLDSSTKSIKRRKKEKEKRKRTIH